MNKANLPEVDLQERFNELFQNLPQGSVLYAACQKLYVDGVLLSADETSDRIIRLLAKHAIPFTRFKDDSQLERITIA
ncbi:hypothetical protein [Brevibacillus marinus]|uniref:hypothetical protein n=1 Tax=Brevibacillus marinus TaxID=2496837 RepID=UPI000F81D429|nr:hypothetical protein [Brevibacillus marinus]